MNKLISYFIKHGLLVDLLTIFVLIVGVVAFTDIRREAFPNVEYDIITVTTPFPGASTTEVEKLLTSPIERALKEVEGIKKMNSVSIENRSTVVIQLDPDQTTADEAKTDVEEVIDRSVVLPEGAEDPLIISADSSIVPIVEIALSNEKLSEPELRAIAKDYERQLEDVLGVARVDINGIRDFEIHVKADPAKLRRYSVSLIELFQALRVQNVTTPGGTFEEGSADGVSKEVIIRTVGEFETAKDVGETVIRANALGRPIQVKDVADVTQGFEEQTEIYRVNSNPTMSLVIFKKARADAINVVDGINERLEQLISKAEVKVETKPINDLSYFIRRRLGVLGSNLAIGLVLVILILSAVLPGRVALITAAGIPLAFLGSIMYLNYVDISLNLLSMIGLIIVVGMLVDDAVVVTENIQRLVDEGMDPEEAARQGTIEVAAPVAASVATTVMAFLPMAFMSGIFGKFIYAIPIAVISALIFSLLEAYFILPYHMKRFAVPRAQSDADAGFLGRLAARSANYWEQKVVPGYGRLLSVVLKVRYLVLVGVVIFFFASLFVAKNYMLFILFPPSGIERFQIDFSTAIGTPIETTAEIAMHLEAQVQALPSHELDAYTTKIGIQQASPDDPNVKRGGEYGQIQVYLTPASSRDRSAEEIANALRDSVGKPARIDTIFFQQARSGPPVSKPISIGVRSENYTEILPAVEDLRKLVSELAGVTDLQISYVEGKDEIRVKVDSVEASAAGLGVEDVGRAVRAAYEGLVPTTINQVEEEIDVRISLTETARNRLSTLSQLQIPNNQGNLISLGRIASFERGRGVQVIEHENSVRQVRLLGEVDTDVTSPDAISAAVQARIGSLQNNHPNVQFYFGGEDFETKESVDSLMKAFLIAAGGILLILILTFQSLLQPLLILLSIPLGILSVVWTFFFHGMPLTFLGMLGTIALAGVVVNNAIVFVDFVNQRRKAGEDFHESIMSAAKTRLRPIFLTTLTTVAGILPTAYGLGGEDPFVVPIALALGWGLLFGAFLTTIVIPASLAVLDDLTIGTYKMLGKDPSKVGHQGLF